MFKRYAIGITIFCTASFLSCMDQYPTVLHSGLHGYLTKRKNNSINSDESSDGLAEIELSERLSRPYKFTQSHIESMRKLYIQVHSFFSCKQPKYLDLVSCINECDKAKANGITHDFMGKFAFQEDGNTFASFQQTSLFFYFLKAYNETVRKTGETPFSVWSPLEKRLVIGYNKNNACSAIELLINDSNKLLSGTIPYYSEISHLIHSNKKLDNLDSSIMSFGLEWKKQFLADAYEYFCSKVFNEYKLHAIVVMVTKAQEQANIEDEKALGYYVLNSQSAHSNGLFTHIFGNPELNQHGRISLLCSCIEKYNASRGNKKTPSVQLYRVYNALKSLHIALPDAFDSSLLDDEYVAFTQYEEFLQDVAVLVQSYDDAVEKCVETLYPKKISC